MQLVHEHKQDTTQIDATNQNESLKETESIRKEKCDARSDQEKKSKT